jgi:hypothetical protein
VRASNYLGPLSPDSARIAYGALREVVEANGAAGPRGAQLLRVAASALHLGDAAAASSRGASALRDSLPDALPDVETRELLACALVVAACIEGEVTPAGMAKATEHARALEVRSKWIELLPALHGRRVFAVKRALVRSTPDARRIFARTWKEEGVRGIWTVLAFLLGIHRDPALAARFRALSNLAEGTFGRQFHDALADRGLTFPGERGGLPERMIHHDLMHVVNGYGTDPAGECELAGFYAGHCWRRGVDGWFTFIVTVLATFQFGMPVSPAIVTPARGAFDPDRVLAGFLRGLRMSADVMGPWDYWSLMPLSIADARSQLGIGDLDSAGELEHDELRGR